MNKAIPPRSGFLLEKLDQRVVRALQEHAAHRYALVDASLFEGVDCCSIGRAGALTIVHGVAIMSCHSSSCGT